MLDAKATRPRSGFLDRSSPTLSVGRWRRRRRRSVRRISSRLHSGYMLAIRESGGMRTKHSASKEITRFCTSPEDPMLTPQRPLGSKPDLRKSEGNYRGRSRSGGTTPRCISQSPSPKCDFNPRDCPDTVPAPATTTTDTPRTFLIKDFLSEADTRLLVEPAQTGTGKVVATGRRSPKNVITCTSPVSSANRFLSEIEEVEWSCDGVRIADVASSAAAAADAQEGQSRLADLRKLRGKAQVEEDRGKAPIAFPIEEDQLPRPLATRCYQEKAVDQNEAGSCRVPCGMPAWFTDAYKSLAQIDDQDGAGAATEEEGQEDRHKAASSSSSHTEKEEPASSSTQGCPEFSRPAFQEADCFEPDQDFTSDLTSSERLSLGDRVQSEIRKVIFEGAEESKEMEQEESGHERQGPGWLWKMSLCASVSFVTWVLVNGAKIQCRSLFPTIREREQPLKIVRRKTNAAAKVYPRQNQNQYQDA